MTGHEYLAGLLAKQQLQDWELDPLRQQRDAIESVLRRAYGSEPRVYYGGSYGKKTMIRAGYDLDIIVYFSPTTSATLRDIFNSVHTTLVTARYVVEPKTVALRIPSRQGFHVDVVPGRAHDETYYYATLYKNGENTTMQTSLKNHIDSVKDIRDIVKLMKLWRLCHNLEWKTFALEQVVSRGLYGRRKDDYEDCLMAMFQFIRDSILTIRLVDPANSNNIIEMSAQVRASVRQAAIGSLSQPTWGSIVW